MSAERPPKQAETISLADEEAVRQLLTQTIFNLWDVVNNLTRLRPSKRDRFRVTIFGSARARPGTFVYEECRRVAQAIAELGCDIITGGGPGLMQAANEGAAAAGVPERSHSVGIRIDLPFEQEGNPFVDEMFTHRTFFTRLHQFVLMSDAYVVAPGGIGTVLEASMIWQLLQVRHAAEAPLVFVGTMWREWVEWAERSMLGQDLQLADPRDLQIPRCVDSADQAIEIIREQHAAWLDSVRKRQAQSTE